MGSILRSPKDFWLGVIYAVVGAASFLIARDYPFGSSASIDAGYFPSVVSCLLFLIGVFSIGRSVTLDGGAVDRLDLKSLALIVGSTVLFGFLVDRAGFAAAAIVLLFMSAAASRQFAFRWLSVAGALFLAVVCTIVFVSGLGIPMPIVGPWLGG